MRAVPARTLAAAGTAGTGAVAAAAAYLVVRGLPGMLYAAGICLAAFVGTFAIVAGGRPETPRLELEAGATTTSRLPFWRRKSRRIAELEIQLGATATELEEHRRACANLATQLSRESETAQQNAAQLQRQIRELEKARDGLQELVAAERERFEQTLDELGGGIGGHANELAKLERELEALIAR